ncbi:hypothetical protein CcaverHIS002_0311050 [Cutaneotrichosporon cavernicola]|uniref:Nucleic acid-binding protein n=1 Tax=Cutaneotrichosporon cavernicola TaxID=279322 RepID=A0AA48QV51_9TREE|nr:uncharacterized protein CcaverHIS019_0310910 [Cutaneotrichosporon cavernicola]BEI83237.1 hypothetical protein CcaverHIS002_0311050 [Cutaneotrichosporon cavernicola]BEI91021.1 hypothetical protein CcaverHIS019_0310910 [Cutaneotrichosporon cavernicola]BEI98800.1 hypothetical protein CcaverHIS631_0310990 [Cutaneotrichosporon cavernicola]BEJ06572.1 hypothetical protein CcaverHIS641_0310940 [Cutaneotrichosporon cavernicola]
MFGLARPTINTAKASFGQRGYAKATLIGRLGGKPEVRQAGNGKNYVTYNLAVPKPPKRNEEGEVIRDENGYTVRDTNWFTIFNFRPTAAQYMANLEPGTQLMVEATLETRTTPTEAGNVKDVLLREISHQVVSRKKN